jgi:hypothetical protein
MRMPHETEPQCNRRKQAQVKHAQGRSSTKTHPPGRSSFAGPLTACQERQQQRRKSHDHLRSDQPHLLPARWTVAWHRPEHVDACHSMGMPGTGYSMWMPSMWMPGYGMWMPHTGYGMLMPDTGYIMWMYRCTAPKHRPKPNANATVINAWLRLTHARCTYEHQTT